MKYVVSKKLVNVPSPTELKTTELPGLALANGSYDGFGKKLCISVEDGAEEFGESEEE